MQSNADFVKCSLHPEICYTSYLLQVRSTILHLLYVCEMSLGKQSASKSVHHTTSHGVGREQCSADIGRHRAVDESVKLAGAP